MEPSSEQSALCAGWPQRFPCSNSGSPSRPTAYEIHTNSLRSSRSIPTDCSSASASISKTSPALRNFVREVREARTELDAVVAELHSLEGVLDILKDDANSFPWDLAKRTPPLLQHCTSIINQIEGYMHVCNGVGLSKRDKKFRWLAIRGDMMKLRLTLEGYKSILALVTDLVGLYVLGETFSTPNPCSGCWLTRRGHRSKSRRENDQLSVNSDSSRYDDAIETQAATHDDIKSDLTHVMADMGSLRGRLQGDFRSNYAVSDLASYLDAMQLQATNLGYRLGAEGLETPTAPCKSADRGNRHPSSGTNSSMGDEPDSAIDVNDGPPSPYQRSPNESSFSRGKSKGDRERPVPLVNHSLPIFEIEEFPDDVHEPSRAPTPPPKARARGNSVLSSGAADTYSTLTPFADGNLPGLARPPSARSMSEYSAMLHDSEGNPIVPRRTSSLRSLQESEGDARSTVGSLTGVRPPYSESNYGGAYSGFENQAVITTTITGGAASPSKEGRASRTSSRLFGRNNSFSVPGRSTRPASMQGHRRSSSSSRGEGGGRRNSHLLLDLLSGPGAALAVPASRLDSDTTSPRHTPSPRAEARPDSATVPLPRHVRKASVATTHTAATTQSSSTRAGRPSTSGVASSAAASIRSSGSRVSSVFKRMTLWKPRVGGGSDGAAAAAAGPDPEPDDIFGVSLKKSMQMASAAVRTHHDGSKGSSRREFPRCVLMCVNFIRDSGGVRAPNIFGGGGGGYGDLELGDGGGSAARVAALKEAFGAAPHYGDGNVDWSRHDAHDAAEVVVAFLQQLPRPLIGEAVAKRWVVMSKQATLPGSMGLRLDSCIDFWDEALLGVRGSAARSLLKLLLNLWGDIADAADANDMTAERLAARLLNPLMHLPAGKYTTDYMLGLAFLIRKRSEYAIMLREGRKSHAAFAT